MEAVLTRKPKKEFHFTRKLTPEEIRAILDNYDYDPDYDDEDDLDEPAPVFDKFGNPTRETFDAMYEDEHGLTTPTTLDELLAWVDSL